MLTLRTADLENSIQGQQMTMTGHTEIVVPSHEPSPADSPIALRAEGDNGRVAEAREALLDRCYQDYWTL